MQLFSQGQRQPEPVPAAQSGAPLAPKKPSFGEYLRAVGDVVQSGSVRVAATDDNTDFYTIPLTQEALRPGTVFADPYGHVLMLVMERAARHLRLLALEPFIIPRSTPLKRQLYIADIWHIRIGADFKSQLPAHIQHQRIAV
jgi:hypothetical protein